MASRPQTDRSSQAGPPAAGRAGARRPRRTILLCLAAGLIAVAIAFAAAEADAAFTGGGASTIFSEIITSAGNFPPVESAPPVFTATAQQGQQLSATNGTWTRAPAVSTGGASPCHGFVASP